MQNKRIKEKIRVCHIIYDLSTAGAQTVVMNYLRQIENNSEFEFEVLIRGKYNASTYENEAKEKGYKLYYNNILITRRILIKIKVLSKREGLK